MARRRRMNIAIGDDYEGEEASELSLIRGLANMQCPFSNM